jgi:hypothetical protein
MWKYLLKHVIDLHTGIFHSNSQKYRYGKYQTHQTYGLNEKKQGATCFDVAPCCEQVMVSHINPP